MDKLFLLSIIYIIVLAIDILYELFLNDDSATSVMITVVFTIGIVSTIAYYKYKIREK